MTETFRGTRRPPLLHRCRLSRKRCPPTGQTHRAWNSNGSRRDSLNYFARKCCPCQHPRRTTLREHSVPQTRLHLKKSGRGQLSVEAAVATRDAQSQIITSSHTQRHTATHGTHRHSCTRTRMRGPPCVPAAACWLPPVGQSLAAVPASPHESVGLSRTPRRERTAPTVSRRNVPHVFAHVPQFAILRSNKERALYGSNFFLVAACQ